MNDSAHGRPKLLATVTVHAGNNLLLVKYTGVPDHQRGWFMPHDLVEHRQHPDAVVAALLRDQLGWSDVPATLSHIESFTGNDGSWHLVFHYAATLSARPPITLSPDVDAAAWFAPDALPPRDDVSHHGWALDVAAEVRARRAAPATTASV